ncbi:MAG: hypothetical protein A2096_05080 [Spirochaetes bacterium GWF1_41_5]|nr:MAG: hypothetical protein A2096_05080 [Spirochaetes bacterium GWF1_41_5]
MSIFFILFQLLPIMVYILVDSIFNNPVISIIAAITAAAVQTAYGYYSSGSIDYFILLDTGLIILMGVISITARNELFFKIKPGIIEIIMIFYLLFLVMAPDTVMINYFSRMMPAEYKLNPMAAVMLKKTIILFIIFIILHAASVFYTAFYSSKKIWAFVSGPGLYFIFIPVMIYVFYKKFVSGKNVARPNN